ncbi:probable serine hydrolase [Drosophila sechellia]|uniref:GM14139 n=1 Tax=Drosophila sechellia TaxID=7238 RepID=B4HW49_DROSE|nr:probable serine hydrolase [Drosophila sechellia]EDW50164.1 GM14139 [Drosophila sechellia]
MGTMSLSDFKEVKIPAPWGHISGCWYGNRTERPILAIHGWLDNLGTFDRLIPLLPDYIGVLCIDLPGHGRSARIQPGMHYAVNDYVLIIPRVMQEYGWSKVSLMGHSLGGIISFIYTSLAPHTVDMVISLDILLPWTPSPKTVIKTLAHSLEKHLVEEDRQEEGNLHEPPSYTLAQLNEVLAKGSYNSVTPEFAQHLLHRQVSKSQLYPDRFFFSRDGRVKYYSLTQMEPGFSEALAKRIRRKPYLIIKGSRSNFVGVRTEKAVAILRHNNPHFEFYEVEGGTHHVHLHAAEECARYIVPFIRHHRPPALTSWSLSGKEQHLSAEERRRQQERFFKRSTHAKSKL